MSLATDRSCSGPLVLGVPDELAAALRDDPGVRWAGTAPCLTPLDRLPWWSAEFFDGHPDWAPLFHVNPLLDTACDAVLDGTAAGTWVTEVPLGMERTVTEGVERLAGAAGLQATAFALLGEEVAVEEHFAIPVRQRGGATAGRFVPADAWAAVETDGARVRPASMEGVRRCTDEGPIPMDLLWQLYHGVMSTLSRHHPIDGVLPRGDIDALARSDGSALLALEVDGAPASMALVSTDLDAFGWLDPRWVDELRLTHGIDEVLLIPGIVTSPAFRDRNVVDALLDAVLEMVVAAGSDVIIVFPCNNLSRAYTPRLSQQTMERYRDHLEGDVELVASYEFRGYRVG